MKKKIKLISIALLALLINISFVQVVDAASATIKVTSSSSTVLVGGTVTAYVTVSSSSPIGAWEYSLNYDSSDLTLKSGKSYIADYATNGSKYKATYTYTFTAKTKGKTSISVKNTSVLGWDESSYNTSVSSRTINVITQAELEASYSKNNNLSELKVDGVSLVPEFKSDITEYTVELEPLTEKIKVDAVLSDKKSSVSGIGEIEVSEGSNIIEIKVTAQNGSIKTYKINAIVKELEPINVTIDKEKYTIVRNAENLEKPSTFVEGTYTYDGKEIPV